MEYDKHKMARAKMTNVVVSPKDSREISSALRGKSLAAGIALLSDVQEKKRPIRYTRFNQESAGHRRGTGPGRYPYKAAVAFEDLLVSVRSNAEFKDLDPEILRIVHVKADTASRPFRYGRHRGRQGKRAHIEVIVQEDEKLGKTKKKQSVTATKQKATSQKARSAPKEGASKEGDSKKTPSEGAAREQDAAASKPTETSAKKPEPSKAGTSKQSSKESEKKPDQKSGDAPSEAKRSETSAPQKKSTGPKEGEKDARASGNAESKKGETQ